MMRRASATRAASSMGCRPILILNAVKPRAALGSSWRRQSRGLIIGFGEVSAGRIDRDLLALPTADQVGNRQVQQLAHRIVRGDVDATHQCDELVLRAEVIHPRQHGLRRAALREHAAADVKRLHHLQIGAADGGRAPAFADALHTVFRFQDHQPAAAPIGEAARRAIALAGWQGKFQSGTMQNWISRMRDIGNLLLSCHCEERSDEAIPIELCP